MVHPVNLDENHQLFRLVADLREPSGGSSAGYPATSRAPACRSETECPPRIRSCSLFRGGAPARCAPVDPARRRTASRRCPPRRRLPRDGPEPRGAAPPQRRDEHLQRVIDVPTPRAEVPAQGGVAAETSEVGSGEELGVRLGGAPEQPGTRGVFGARRGRDWRSVRRRAARRGEGRRGHQRALGGVSERRELPELLRDAPAQLIAVEAQVRERQRRQLPELLRDAPRSVGFRRGPGVRSPTAARAPSGCSRSVGFRGSSGP